MDPPFTVSCIGFMKEKTLAIQMAIRQETAPSSAQPPLWDRSALILSSFSRYHKSFVLKRSLDGMKCSVIAIRASPPVRERLPFAYG